MNDLTLSAGAVTLKDLYTVYCDEAPVIISDSCRPSVEAATEQILKAAEGEHPSYGVNTGFGKLASLKIAPENITTLQRNLILSHCCGVGERISNTMASFILSLKLISLGPRVSGVRWDILELIRNMLLKGVTPLIPAQGSFGASGDLAPLAHMSAVLIGEGEAESKVKP